MNKIKPFSKAKLQKLKYKGNAISVEKYKGNFKRDTIRKLVQDRSDRLKAADFNGKISVSLHYPNQGWRSGYFTTVGDKVAVYSKDSYEEEDDDEPDVDNFNSFQIYYMKDGAKAGGCDGMQNDCLFYCLKAALGEHQKMKFPAQLKTFLKLQRTDCVPIDKIATIEESLKLFSINVSGDHTYTSTKQSNRVINLKLIDGHYTLQAAKVKVQGIAYKEKLPLFYGKIHNNTYTVYDKVGGERVLTKTEFCEIKSKPISSPYIIIPTDPKSKDSIETQYNAFIQDAETLKTETKGLINLYKTGRDVKTALSLFNHFNKTIQAEPIAQVEGEWINKASYAALIFADKYTGPLYKYDVCSHYPAAMSSHLVKFPIKPGKFNLITNEEFEALEHLPYGIYRCVIKPNDTVYKQFRYNPLNHYTHIDLAVARDLKLDIVMVQDLHPNQLLYAADCLVTGHQLFKPYCDYLFALKDRNVCRAKSLLNKLWGALCQKNIITMIVADDDDDTDIRGDKTITKIFPKSDTQTQVEFYKNDSLYETNWGRIAPFILSRGRQQIRKWMLNDTDSIVRCHTDGFCSTKPLTDIKLGTKMGDLKYEGHCVNATVQNNIKIEGKFFI